jgi:CheY-like chemotaxis protein
MIPEHPAKKSGDGANHEPVALPNLGLLGAYQPVILVADDEPLLRNLVTLLLQHDGYFVLSAADGHEGLELSRKYPGTIDLLITDVDMPRMNGTNLCGHLMEERPAIKVLVMSGADISEIVSQMLTCNSAQATRRADSEGEGSGNPGRSRSVSDPLGSLRSAGMKSSVNGPR